MNLHYTYSQTGIYISATYEFTSERDITLNHIDSGSYLLTIDFDAVINKYFMWRQKGEGNEEDLFLKWAIISKVDTKFDKQKNLVVSTYEAKFEFLGLQTDDIVYLTAIDDLNDNSYNICIYNPKYQSTSCFYKLKKI